MKEQTDKSIHLLRYNHTTACGKNIGIGVNYTPRVFPWEEYGDVTCNQCKKFIDRLNLKSRRLLV